MFEREINTFRFMGDYTVGLMADITDPELCLRPTTKMSHAAWILGHLTAVHDRVSQSFGGERRLDDRWHDLFKPGSTVSDDASLYPDKSELMAAYNAGRAALPDVVRAIPAEKLAEPNPRERMKDALPTTHDFLAFVLTGHEAMHAGQLSAWRRAIGRDPLF